GRRSPAAPARDRCRAGPAAARRARRRPSPRPGVPDRSPARAPRSCCAHVLAAAPVPLLGPPLRCTAGRRQVGGPAMLARSITLLTGGGPATPCRRAATAAPPGAPPARGPRGPRGRRRSRAAPPPPAPAPPP